jgi:site-specific DNA recombinase
LICPINFCSPLTYIAVNDSIDTMQANNDIAPFQNILNEWYPKDISKKVRQVKKSSARQGKFMGSKAPYGYVKSPSDKHKLIIDEESGRIVKRIFHEFACGDSGRQIAIRLNSEGVDSPRAYYYKLISQENPNPNESNTWCSSTVMQLLKNQVYIGNMVQGKRQVVSFKSKRREFTNPEDWIKVDNTHEAIISHEEWEIVQKRIVEKKHVRTNSKSEISLFAGILKCADCGGALAFNIKRLANGTKNLYKCSRSTNHGTQICSAHYTLETTLIDAVLNDIKSNAFLALRDRDALIKKLLKQASDEQQKDSTFFRSKLREINKRIGTIDAQIKNLYEDKCAGILPESIFQNLLSDYGKERDELESKLPDIQKAIAESENKTTDVTCWVSLIEKYLEIKTLDRNTVVELIEIITVSEPYAVDGEKHQDISIKYKFVGYLTPNKAIEDVA